VACSCCSTPARPRWALTKKLNWTHQHLFPRRSSQTCAVLFCSSRCSWAATTSFLYHPSPDRWVYFWCYRQLPRHHWIYSCTWGHSATIAPHISSDYSMCKQAPLKLLNFGRENSVLIRDALSTFFFDMMRGIKAHLRRCHVQINLSPSIITLQRCQ